MSKENLSEFWSQIGINDPGKITIPGAYYLYKGQQFEHPDSIVDVQRVDSDWLASDERTWEEVDGVLEGHLQGIERSVQNNENSPYLGGTIFDGKIDNFTARLIAYSALLTRYKIFETPHNNDINSLVNKRDQRIEQIKSKGGNPRAVHVKVERVRDEYDEKMKTPQEARDVKRRVQQLLLRKAVLDVFSPDAEKLHVSKLAEVYNEISAASVGSQIQLEKAEDFMASLTEFLSETEDNGLFERYRYKESRGIVKSKKDINVLSSVIEMTVGQRAKFLQEQGEFMFSNLGQAYFDFLTNRSIRLSESGLDLENYPRTSLIYDTMTASFAVGEVSTIHSTQALMEERFGYLTSDYYFSSEIKKIAADQEKSTESQKWFDKITSDVFQAMSQQGEWPSMYDVENYPQEVLDHLATDEFRLKLAVRMLSGESFEFSTLRTNELSQPVTDLIEAVMKTKINNKLKTEGRRLNKRPVVFDPALFTIPYHEIFPHLGIEQDLCVYLSTSQMEGKISGETIIGDAVVPGQEQDGVELFQQAIDAARRDPEAFKETVIGTYVNAFWDEESKKEKLSSIEEENLLLAEEVSNKSVWFVSPRGDMFTQLRDEELAEKGIKSVRFDIDRKYPREHKVTLEFDQNNSPIYSFWLDREGKLKDVDSERIPTDPANISILRNIFLRRLWVITSGQLKSLEQDVDSNKDLSKPNGEYVRAFYRVYNPGSYRYREEHAEEIDRIYGIDLAKENSRRQELGVLEPNQYMTFVSERVPAWWTPELKTNPNELPFKSEWVRLKKGS